MLQAVLSTGFLTDEKFEILDLESAKAWYLKRGFKKTLRKDSTHTLTVGAMENGCFIKGSYKNFYLTRNS